MLIHLLGWLQQEKKTRELFSSSWIPLGWRDCCLAAQGGVGAALWHGKDIKCSNNAPEGLARGIDQKSRSERKSCCSKQDSGSSPLHRHIYVRQWLGLLHFELHKQHKAWCWKCLAAPQKSRNPLIREWRRANISPAPRFCAILNIWIQLKNISVPQSQRLHYNNIFEGTTKNSVSNSLLPPALFPVIPGFLHAIPWE